MTEGTAQERLAGLEQRLAHLEDERAVARLIAAYGPLVDSGSAEAVAALWEPDGVYDVDELLMRGREEIAAMVRSDAHRGWIAGGCAHVVGPAHVTVDGDEAVAVCHSLMVVREGGACTVRRATANHWRLRRGPDGWRVAVRTSRVLDGRPESPALLASLLAGTA
ncbi:nuclear transport factor 2 family protein [Streptomyces thermolineatus]|uniref:Nuclear transport factor 2 family protein n=1 Tax=Streptomyces thermolineatus TaxID=44033 RepID=A0ABN3LGH8_9ACTN